MIAVNKAMHLNNGDTIKPKSYCEIYSVGVNNDFQVIGKSLLATTNAGISNYGILNTASGMHYVFKFTKFSIFRIGKFTSKYSRVFGIKSFNF